MMKSIEDKTEQSGKSAKQRLLESPGFLNADVNRISEETAAKILGSKERLHKELMEGKYKNTHFTDRCINWYENYVKYHKSFA